MEESAQAILIDAVGGFTSKDGLYGIIEFGKNLPMDGGSTSFHVGVPIEILPHLSALAVGLIPQPEPGLSANHPVVFKPETTRVGRGPEGQVTLTVVLEPGYSLTYELDRFHAQSLSEGLAIALGILIPTTQEGATRN